MGAVLTIEEDQGPRCLWDAIEPVAREGMFCSYECYAFWLAHNYEHGNMIVVPDDEPAPVPAEEHSWWR